MSYLYGGKPVLDVDNFKEGAKIPLLKPGSNKMIVRSNTNIGEDGKATVTISTYVTGVMAYSTYKYFKDMTEKELEEAALQIYGYADTAEVIPGTWNKEDLSYENIVKFSINNFVEPESEGLFFAQGLYANNSIIAQSIVPSEYKEKGLVDYDFLCVDANLEEEYTYTLPDNMTFLSVPENVSVSSKIIKYNSEYNLSEKTLHIVRKLNDMTQGPVCKPDIYDEYVDISQKIWPDIWADIVVK